MARLRSRRGSVAYGTVAAVWLRPLTVERHSQRWRTLAWSFAAAGVLLRLVQYGWNRSWWIDESMVVLNIVQRTAGELMGPLDLNQAAPPLFLLIERAAVVTLGTSEHSLRLFPLLCGIAAVVVITAVAVRWIGGPGAALTAGVVAFSETLIWHSVEAKPYSSDVLLAAVVWWMAVRADQADAPGALRRWLGWCGVSAVLLWASYPLIFVVVGIVLVRLARLAPGAGPAPWNLRRLALWAAGAAVPAVSFGLLWFLVIRHQQQGDLYQYWDESFADWSRPWTLPFWTVDGMNSIFNYVVPDMGAPLLALGIVAFIAAWQHRRERDGEWERGLRLVAPILLTMAAGAVGEYPFPGRRLTVFLAPALCWLAGSGFLTLLAWVVQRWPNRRLALYTAGAVGVLPLLVSLGAVLPQVVDPPHRGQIRPAARELLRHYQDEPVAVLGEVRPLQLYATTAGQWQRLRDQVVASFGTPDTDTEAAMALIDEAREAAGDDPGRGRYWIIFEYPGEEVRRNYLVAVESVAPEARPRLEVDGAMLLEVSPEAAPAGVNTQ